MGSFSVVEICCGSVVLCGAGFSCGVPGLVCLKVGVESQGEGSADLVFSIWVAGVSQYCECILVLISREDV